jgi:Na+/proline symporter
MMVDRGGLSLLDWAVVAVYFVAMAWIGFAFSKRQTTTSQYFAGGRAIPIGVKLRLCMAVVGRGVGVWFDGTFDEL